jgi:hypothetical protein
VDALILRSRCKTIADCPGGTLFARACQSTTEESSVKPNLLSSSVLLLCLASTGCVYVNGERIDDDWRASQRENREAISRLELGMSHSAVIERLGTPADSEAFTRDGEQVRVLFYRTQHAHSDGETTRDETTPVVFRSDRLIGWGNSVYQSLF